MLGLGLIGCVSPALGQDEKLIVERLNEDSILKTGKKHTLE
jgi:hypothetical protein